MATIDEARDDLMQNVPSFRGLALRVEAGQGSEADEQEYNRAIYDNMRAIEAQRLQDAQDEAEERAWVRGSAGIRPC